MAQTPRTSPTPPSPASSKRALKEAPKSFTLAEATKALPYVRRVVADIVEASARVHALEQGKAKAVPADVRAASDRYEGLTRELKLVGVELKDPNIGLIDFPSRHKTKPVYLCWKLGEEAIAHFHDVDSGFASRQPIADLDEGR